MKVHAWLLALAIAALAVAGPFSSASVLIHVTTMDGPVPAPRLATTDGPVPAPRLATTDGPVPAPRLATTDGPVPAPRAV